MRFGPDGQGRLAVTIGFIILAHERQDRVGQLARHLQAHGAEVVVHLDRRVTPQDLDGIDVLQTQASDWGRFSLVEATLDAARHLLAKADLSHIALISGSCLPVRPVAELQGHLAAHPSRDFIESVDIASDAWVEDGLSEERFTLWHPFSHRYNPKLFSASVDVQRTLKVRRKVPKGLRPHLGSQWWMLCAETLRAILDDPRLPAWKRFFRTTWIPDESFFQTVARAVAPQSPLPSLHFSQFDPRGKPYVFHDEHAGLLQQSGAFLARKIDPDADGLYQLLLEGKTKSAASEHSIVEAITQARDREIREGKGLLSAGRFPGGTKEAMVETAAPYLVVVSEDDAILKSLALQLDGTPDVTLHGQLFAPSSANFADGSALLNGNIPDNPIIRDYRPAQFLQRLVWVNRAGRTAFFYRPTDPAPEAGQLINDGNARLVLIGDGIRLTNLLRRPMPTKRRLRFRKPLEHPIWAWRRVIDPIHATTAEGLEELRAILKSDWRKPGDWTVPDDAKVPA